MPLLLGSSPDEENFFISFILVLVVIIVVIVLHSKMITAVQVTVDIVDPYPVSVYEAAAQLLDLPLVVPRDEQLPPDLQGAERLLKLLQVVLAGAHLREVVDQGELEEEKREMAAKITSTGFCN